MVSSPWSASIVGSKCSHVLSVAMFKEVHCVQEGSNEAEETDVARRGRGKQVLER